MTRDFKVIFFHILIVMLALLAVLFYIPTLGHSWEWLNKFAEYGHKKGWVGEVSAWD